MRVFVVCLCFLAAPAWAAETAEGPALLGTYGAWQAYTTMEGDQKVCYMTAAPDTMEGEYTTRGPVWAILTHRTGEGDVFTYEAGYTYKTASTVGLAVDSKAFTLFTKGTTAWANTTADDSALAKAIATGSVMVIKGVSSRGTSTSDSFTLKGSNEAYKAILSTCGLVMP